MLSENTLVCCTSDKKVNRINDDGTSYIIDTSKLVFSPDGTIQNHPEDKSPNQETKPEEESLLRVEELGNGSAEGN